MTVEYKDSKRITAVSSDWETDTTSNITWSTTGKVGWNISGTTISRTGSDGWGTSKIQSTDTFTVGNGKFMIEFSGNEGSTMLGFNQGTLGYYIGSPQNQNDFSIYLAGGSTVEVYESGNKNYDSGGSRNASDKFRIEIDNSGVVKYYHQAGGTGSFDLKHTSSSTASGTYFIQANAYSSTSEATVHSKTVTTAVAKPSNVQDNSLLVEKDTARRYWFDGTTWNMQPTYPYSSTGWSATGGGAVATDNLTLALDTDGGQDQVNYDLTSISSDKFVLDFTLNFSRLTIGTNIFWFMGLVNSTNWISTNSTNHMGIFVMQESGTKTFSCSDGTGTWNGASEDAQTWTPSTGVDYYFRLTKLTSTTYKVELFGDSARTSVTSTSDGTVSSMTDLRYLVFTGDNNSGTGNATFTISDLKFYDGVSSIN